MIVGGIVCSIILLVGAVVIYNRMPQHAPHTPEDDIQAQKRALQKQNVAGLTEHAFVHSPVAHHTTIENKMHDDVQKEWLVVHVDDVAQWQAIDTDKKTQIMEGLINTSRLRIDRDFGGVQIVDHNGDIVVQGWWSDAKKYVIL